MPNRPSGLDDVFQALADPTRRRLVERLIEQPAAVSELAKPFSMSLPAVMQHLQVLEACGVVRSEKVGRVRTCRVEPGALRAAEEWLGQQRSAWERRLDRLGQALAESPDIPEMTKPEMTKAEMTKAEMTKAEMTKAEMTKASQRSEP
jgi:DNA-binding transcriptional ArsR family regulator